MVFYAVPGLPALAQVIPSTTQVFIGLFEHILKQVYKSNYAEPAQCFGSFVYDYIIAETLSNP